MKTLFTQGTLVTATRTFVADLLVEGERIAAISHDLPADGAAIINAQGLYLLPGGVDVHTHLDMPLDEIASSDDFTSGHVAAAFGGTTSHIDFAIQAKGRSLRETLDTWQAKAAGRACIDYGFHMTITDVTPAILQEVSKLPEWGVTSIKMLMAYRRRGLQVADADLFALFRAAADCGILPLVHAEHGDIIDLLVEEAVARRDLAPRFHALTRPAELEGEATGRAIALAAVAGSPLYVVHLTCAHALQQVRAAQARGLPVWAETCVQYLFFTADELDRPNFEGAKFVCSPPFRAASDREALWDGLRDSTLSVVSTDHCPFFFATQKARGRGDFTKIPNGVPAIEDRLMALYQGGVVEGRIPLTRFVELTSTNPSRLFGLYPRKGSLEVGADADLVLWDPAVTRTLSARTHHMRVDYNLFEGMVVRGAPRAVWVRGQQVVDGDRFIGRPGSGQFLRRNKFSVMEDMVDAKAGTGTRSR